MACFLERREAAAPADLLLLLMGADKEMTANTSERHRPRVN